jgi:GT2 family glycosyltransferase
MAKRSSEKTEIPERLFSRHSEMSPEDWPRVWAVVLNWKNPEMTVDCVRLLEKSGYPNLEILIVDNGSSDGSRQILLNEFPEHHHLSLPMNLGYAGGNAAGMLHALRDPETFAVLVINNDCLVTEGFLFPLVNELLEHDDTAVAGPVQLYYENEELAWANAGSRFDLWRARVIPDGPSGKSIPRPGGRHVVGFHCGACALYRAEALRDVGTFDPKLFLFGEESDWAFRASKKGKWKTVVLTSSLVVHLESVSTSTVPQARHYYIARNTAWVVRRHGSILQILVHGMRCLLGKGLGFAATKALAGRVEIGWAILKGHLDGLFGDCSVGSLPEEAALQQAFEVSTLEGSIVSFGSRLKHQRGPKPVALSAGELRPPL